VLALDRVRRERRLDFLIEIDGGVTLGNLPDIVRAGVDWVVAGATIFHSPDPGDTVARMRQIAREATAIRV
jgi:ribulose-phosphate 3-epimerase